MDMHGIGEVKLNLIGHPFVPSGRGEDVRCSARSANCVGLNYSLFDIYGEKGIFNPDYFEEFRDINTKDWNSDINVFFLNGDEVEPVFNFLEIDIPKNSYNIISPQWELEIYPDSWAKQLEKFDEIWAPSRFVADALSRNVNKPIIHMPLAVEIKLESFLPRIYFNLPESSYIYLFFFDFKSYMERKNPQAIINSFMELCKTNKTADIRLVLKANKPGDDDINKKEYDELVNLINHSTFGDRIILIDYMMSDNEIKNLILCCDCFMSLHRSEGFGRGLAEAMALSKPVIGTNYSGNLDFMTNTNSYLVEFDLIKVKNGEYPYFQGQRWAEAKIDHAVSLMNKVLRNRDYGRSIGSIAKMDIASSFSYRAIGLHYSNRISQIRAEYL